MGIPDEILRLYSIFVPVLLVFTVSIFKAEEYTLFHCP